MSGPFSQNTQVVVGSLSTSGDNTLVTTSNTTNAFVITHVTLQNASAVATTMTLKLGSTAFEQVLGQNQGDGLSIVYASDARPQAVNAPIVLNLSGANLCDYVIHYYVA